MDFEFDDGLGFEAHETRSERLARELTESDLELIATIRAKRIERGLSQADLGKLLNVSQATVSEFESGMTEPKMQTVRRYAHALGLLIEHVVRDADVVYDQLATSHETQMLAAVLFKKAGLSYSAAANNKRTDFAIAA